jgi:hypothetical protein
LELLSGAWVQRSYVWGTWYCLREEFHLGNSRLTSWICMKTWSNLQLWLYKRLLFSITSKLLSLSL